ncbi:enoyl-CoA hydratase-related protein [Eilatimonas milleporae]|uniref:Enoyl-CoA hydratase n=1 Tax=Eilatimonas milleporae TaxID=911205 RepID=A0A3M0CX72_9PROT|nr:enoyl-CoA hydratase-related protein [Eilatimonas milleporae]RMB12066.1 enoyl-CoA hydratase [Eilatimonas milleporae]
MAYECLAITDEGPVRIITLNRPDRLNAFTVQMNDELLDVLDDADRDDTVRALVFTGAGRAFCAGMDLGTGGNVFGLDESVDVASADMVRNRDLGGILTLRMFRMKKPLIAAVNGASVGVGTTMQLPMDIRIASRHAKFGFVFAERGITLESNASWFLPRLVGMAQALEWALSGRVFGAEEALAGGLVSEIVDADILMERALARAHRFIDRTSAMSVAVNRQLLWRMMGAAHPMEAHRLESRTMYHASMYDGREGVAAFMEKRDAVFSDPVSGGLPAGFDWDREPPFE